LIIIATPHTKYAELTINAPLIDVWRVNSSKSII